MKFTLSWLKEHLDTTASVDEIVETLTRIGLEVEEVINPAAALDGFNTAKIETVEMHPDSDHLHILRVNTGKETLQVVCGAPNVHEGLIGIYAPTGALIPCYGERLKVAKIRGVESMGMMCSEKELMVGDDHSGIIELPADTAIGVPAAEILKIDPVIEVSITPNRAECLGVRGIARDLAAAGLGTLKPLNVKEIKGTFKSPISVNVMCKDACPTYTARYIKGVNNKAETPKWMKDLLTAIGLRPISALVDITNYINYDLARPLHVFDADKLVGNVTVRMAANGEEFVALNEKSYVLDDKSLGICDDEGVQCLGGIMGGLSKGSFEDTTNVLLECALFNPVCIARTGRKLQLDSDSRARYERWVDPMSNISGNNYATQMILDICGGEASEIEVAGEEKFEAKPVQLRMAKMKSFVGMEIEQEKCAAILRNLGFKVSESEGVITAVSPSWRGDIECEQDLIEEVVRMVGLDNIPAVSMKTADFPKPVLTTLQNNVMMVKHELAMRGMYETVTFSFTDSAIAKYFRRGHAPVDIQNPIINELDEMRPSLLPNLLIGAKNNIARGYTNLAIFEVAPEFFGRNPGEQQTAASGILVGKTSKKDWNGTSRAYDVFDAKAAALAAIGAAKGPIEAPQITTDAPQYYHPGRSGAIRLGRNVLAYFGELHPAVLKTLDIKTNVMAFEVFLENIPAPRDGKSKAKKKLELSTLQPVEKDLAFVCDKNVPSINIVTAAKTADRENITDVRIFDVYEGENLAQDKKSIAITVTFQPKEKSYTDAELETLMNKVIFEVGKKTGAALR
ncbi:MAG: phenylalanine--tRNA ligase subunit beta [Alphaproteobacteria bacterium]|nr:phenylalanine--tRNA ligase subunit beta [Alphaproteobacteria bacterium]